MTKNKKYLLSLGLIATAMAPVMTVVACGTTDSATVSDEVAIVRAEAAFKNAWGGEQVSSKTTLTNGEFTSTTDIDSFKANLGLNEYFTFDLNGAKITKYKITDSFAGKKIDVTLTKGAEEKVITEARLKLSTTANDPQFVLQGVASQIISKLDNGDAKSTKNKAAIEALVLAEDAEAVVATKDKLATDFGFAKFGQLIIPTGVTMDYLTWNPKEIGNGVGIDAEININFGGATMQVEFTVYSSEVTDAVMGQFIADLIATSMLSETGIGRIVSAELFSAPVSAGGIKTFTSLLPGSPIFYDEEGNVVDGATKQKFDVLLNEAWMYFGATYGYITVKTATTTTSTSLDVQVAIDYKDGKTYKSVPVITIYKEAA